MATKYYEYSCVFGTQRAYTKDDEMWMETGFEWRLVENEEEKNKIIQNYKEITREEFENSIV
jgi:hypothetical protein